MRPTRRHPTLRDLAERPFAVMGIVNATPDSFYDGGRYASLDAAEARGLALIEQGADIIDVGGESTRPGSAPVSVDEEAQRVVPLIERLAKQTKVPISVDSTKADVVRRALDAGAEWINDVSAGRFDVGMAPLAGQRQCPVVLMHSRGTPQTMQQNPSYEDVVSEVEAELLQSVDVFIAHGVARENIVLDPGIGFAKRFEDNIALLNALGHLAGLGYPVLVGTSRKSFIGQITGKPPNERLGGSLGSVAVAYVRGTRLFRVHDVSETVDLLKVLSRTKLVGCQPCSWQQ